MTRYQLRALTPLPALAFIMASRAGNSLRAKIAAKTQAHIRRISN